MWEPGAGAGGRLAPGTNGGTWNGGCLEPGGASGARGYGVGAGVQAGRAEWGERVWVPRAGGASVRAWNQGWGVRY